MKDPDLYYWDVVWDEIGHKARYNMLIDKKLSDHKAYLLSIRKYHSLTVAERKIVNQAIRSYLNVR